MTKLNLTSLLTFALFLPVAAQAAGQTIRFGPGIAAPTAFDRAAGRYEEGSSFDPYICAEQPCGELLHNIFEGLLSVGDDRVVQPALATDWQRLDDVRFRFNLRRGVKFHNGETFDAEAVRFSLLRASEAFGATAWFPTIVKVDIVGPYVVDVVLNAPDSLFLYRLSYLAPVLPPKYFRQMGVARFGLQPVGTGAFQFVRWDKVRRELVLEANREYWRAGFPKVARVIYRYQDSEKALEALTEGKIDLVRRLNPRKTTQFMETGRGKIIKAWLPQLVLGVFNFLKPHTALQDVRVRRAINLAIDREDLLRYGTIGNGRFIGGYTVPEDPNHAGLSPYAFDPAEARRLLAESGHTNGLKLSMLVTTWVPSRVEKIIAVSLAQVGIEVKLRKATDAELLKELYVHKFGSGSPSSADILLLSMPTGGLPHSGYVPMSLLYSRKPNESAIRDAFLDDLYERALRTYETRAGSVLWKKLERYVYENHLLLIGYQERAVFGANERLRFTPRTLMSFWDASYGPSPHESAPGVENPDRR